MKLKKSFGAGFSLVELVIVIFVIGILAIITYVSYGTIQKKVIDTSVDSDVQRMAALQTNYKANHGVVGVAYYSGNGTGSVLGFTPKSGNVIDVVVNSTGYCVRGYNIKGTTNTIFSPSIKESSPGICDQITASAAAIADSPSGPVVPITAIGAISGTTAVGSVLTAGVLTPSSATATYQWQSATTSGGTYADISGATNSTYTLISGDLGRYLKVTATGSGSYSDTVASIASAVVTTPASPYIQTITAANCPTTRTQVQDARDSHTYWVQKLADGKCWMLTNLGYAGSGTNTYSDTKTLTNGTGGSTTYTVASYYVTPSTTNFTTEPTAPSTSTDGTGQYGYLYNWCAATGGDLASSGCSSTITTPLPVTTASICPAGWRLPTSNGGEFTALNTAINGGSTTTDAGLIGTPWLAQRGGSWSSGFYNQGSNGYYWSSTQYSATSAYFLLFNSTFVGPANNNSKYNGFAVRCVAV